MPSRSRWPLDGPARAHYHIFYERVRRRQRPEAPGGASPTWRGPPTRSPHLVNVNLSRAALLAHCLNQTASRLPGLADLGRLSAWHSGPESRSRPLCARPHRAAPCERAGGPPSSGQPGSGGPWAAARVEQRWPLGAQFVPRVLSCWSSGPAAPVHPACARSAWPSADTHAPWPG